MRRAPTFAIATVAAVVAVAGLAVAQKTKKDKVPTLHEDLPPEANAQQTPTIGASGSGNPAAFVAGKKVVPKPELDSPDSAPKGEPVLGTNSFAADRQTQMTP